MPISLTADANIAQANAMSDHNVQVDENLNLVSQNLQGPYAIKGPNRDTSKPLYSFDLPHHTDHHTPTRLSELTGMTVHDCTLFINANKARNEGELTRILTSYRIGEKLGEGGFRRALETDGAYIARMTRQVDCLKNIMDGGANILSIQEQPYQGLDAKRSAIFSDIMYRAGYVSIASQDRRDVGIWVKETMAAQSRPVPIAGLINPPLRGCTAIVDGFICVNLHSERAINSRIIDALLHLQQTITVIARHQIPPLRISITGDMNLFQLTASEKGRLEARGFTTEMVKGQETMREPSYEAFFRDNGRPHISPTLIKAASAPSSAVVAHPPASFPLILNDKTSSALPNYENISRLPSVKNADLRAMWTSILTSNTKYNPTKDLLLNVATLPLVLQSQMLDTFLKTCDCNPKISADQKIAVARQRDVLKSRMAPGPAHSSSSVTASPASSGAGGGAAAFNKFKQRAEGIQPAPSADQSDYILKQLITVFCNRASLNPGQQDQRGSCTFGVSKSSTCPYIANNDYQILIDKGKLKVLDRNNSFKVIDYPADKNRIIAAMLTLSCKTDEAVRNEVDNITQNQEASSHRLGR